MEGKTMTFERKILRKIFGPVIEESHGRLLMNISLEELYKGVNISTFMKLQHLRWMGHLQLMDDVRNTMKIYQANLHKTDLREDPKLYGKKMWRMA